MNYFLPRCIYNCSGLLKTYAFDDTTIGSWMIGVQATYIDDNRLCCSSTRQGVNTTLSQKLFSWLTEECLYSQLHVNLFISQKKYVPWHDRCIADPLVPDQQRRFLIAFMVLRYSLRKTLGPDTQFIIRFVRMRVWLGHSLQFVIRALSFGVWKWGNGIVVNEV